MQDKQNLFEKGTFFLGCNWWASHAGTNMWHEWREDVVDADVCAIKKAGIEVMRVFPLWPDFQPLRMHYSDKPRELRLREEPLPNTEAGRAGVDPIMIERFDKLCDIAEKYGLTYDEIIRNDGMLLETRRYIEDNPRQWAEDDLYIHN